MLRVETEAMEAVKTSQSAIRILAFKVSSEGQYVRETDIWYMSVLCQEVRRRSEQL
jgi:hypothetical protein